MPNLIGHTCLVKCTESAEFVRNSVQKVDNLLIISILVEVGGLEPPSKQRTRWLSTRLSGLWFSYPVCGEARLSGSYLLGLGGG